MRPSAALLRHAESALRELLAFAAPADQTLSRYFREHRELGQKDRAFVAEASDPDCAFTKIGWTDCHWRLNWPPRAANCSRCQRC